MGDRAQQIWYSVQTQVDDQVLGISWFHSRMYYPRWGSCCPTRVDWIRRPATILTLDSSCGGSSTPSASGTGIILSSPKGEVVEYAFYFTFPKSNNEVEYEALLTGFKLAIELWVSELRVFSDSQLIVGQAQGELKARNPSMINYLKKVKELMARFSSCDLQHIPRFENAQTDRLAKLGTS